MAAEPPKGTDASVVTKLVSTLDPRQLASPPKTSAESETADDEPKTPVRSSAAAASAADAEKKDDQVPPTVKRPEKDKDKEKEKQKKRERVLGEQATAVRLLHKEAAALRAETKEGNPLNPLGNLPEMQSWIKRMKGEEDKKAEEKDPVQEWGLHRSVPRKLKSVEQSMQHIKSSGDKLVALRKSSGEKLEKFKKDLEKKKKSLKKVYDTKDSEQEKALKQKTDELEDAMQAYVDGREGLKTRIDALVEQSRLWEACRKDLNKLQKSATRAHEKQLKVWKKKAGKRTYLPEQLEKTHLLLYQDQNGEEPLEEHYKPMLRMWLDVMLWELEVGDEELRTMASTIPLHVSDAADPYQGMSEEELMGASEESKQAFAELQSWRKKNEELKQQLAETQAQQQDEKLMARGNNASILSDRQERRERAIQDHKKTLKPIVTKLVEALIEAHEPRMSDPSPLSQYHGGFYDPYERRLSNFMDQIDQLAKRKQSGVYGLTQRHKTHRENVEEVPAIFEAFYAERDRVRRLGFLSKRVKAVLGEEVANAIDPSLFSSAYYVFDTTIQQRDERAEMCLRAAHRLLQEQVQVIEEMPDSEEKEREEQGLEDARKELQQYDALRKTIKQRGEAKDKERKSLGAGDALMNLLGLGGSTKTPEKKAEPPAVEPSVAPESVLPAEVVDDAAMQAVTEIEEEKKEEPAPSAPAAALAKTQEVVKDAVAKVLPVSTKEKDTPATPPKPAAADPPPAEVAVASPSSTVSDAPTEKQAEEEEKEETEQEEVSVSSSPPPPTKEEKEAQRQKELMEAALLVGKRADEDYAAIRSQDADPKALRKALIDQRHDRYDGEEKDKLYGFSFRLRHISQTLVTFENEKQIQSYARWMCVKAPEDKDTKKFVQSVMKGRPVPASTLQENKCGYTRSSGYQRKGKGKDYKLEPWVAYHGVVDAFEKHQASTEGPLTEERMLAFLKAVKLTETRAANLRCVQGAQLRLAPSEEALGSKVDKKLFARLNVYQVHIDTNNYARAMPVWQCSELKEDYLRSEQGSKKMVPQIVTQWLALVRAGLVSKNDVTPPLIKERVDAILSGTNKMRAPASGGAASGASSRRKKSDKAKERLRESPVFQQLQRMLQHPRAFAVTQEKPAAPVDGEVLCAYQGYYPILQDHALVRIMKPGPSTSASSAAPTIRVEVRTSGNSVMRGVVEAGLLDGLPVHNEKHRIWRSAYLTWIPSLTIKQDGSVRVIDLELRVPLATSQSAREIVPLQTSYKAVSLRMMHEHPNNRGLLQPERSATESPVLARTMEHTINRLPLDPAKRGDANFSKFFNQLKDLLGYEPLVANDKHAVAFELRDGRMYNQDSQALADNKRSSGGVMVSTHPSVQVWCRQKQEEKEEHEVCMRFTLLTSCTSGLVPTPTAAETKRAEQKQAEEEEDDEEADEEEDEEQKGKPKRKRTTKALPTPFTHCLDAATTRALSRLWVWEDAYAYTLISNPSELHYVDLLQWGPHLSSTITHADQVITAVHRTSEALYVCGTTTVRVAADDTRHIPVPEFSSKPVRAPADLVKRAMQPQERHCAMPVFLEQQLVVDAKSGEEPYVAWSMRAGYRAPKVDATERALASFLGGSNCAATADILHWRSWLRRKRWGVVKLEQKGDHEDRAEFRYARAAPFTPYWGRCCTPQWVSVFTEHHWDNELGFSLRRQDDALLMITSRKQAESEARDKQQLLDEKNRNEKAYVKVGDVIREFVPLHTATELDEFVEATRRAGNDLLAINELSKWNLWVVQGGVPLDWPNTVPLVSHPDRLRRNVDITINSKGQLSRAIHALKVVMPSTPEQKEEKESEDKESASASGSIPPAEVAVSPAPSTPVQIVMQADPSSAGELTPASVAEQVREATPPPTPPKTPKRPRRKVRDTDDDDDDEEEVVVEEEKKQREAKELALMRRIAETSIQLQNQLDGLLRDDENWFPVPEEHRERWAEIRQQRLDQKTTILRSILPQGALDENPMVQDLYYDVLAPGGSAREEWRTVFADPQDIQRLMRSGKTMKQDFVMPTTKQGMEELRDSLTEADAAATEEEEQDTSDQNANARLVDVVHKARATFQDASMRYRGSVGDGNPARWDIGHGVCSQHVPLGSDLCRGLQARLEAHKHPLLASHTYERQADTWPQRGWDDLVADASVCAALMLLLRELAPAPRPERSRYPQRTWVMLALSAIQHLAQPLVVCRRETSLHQADQAASNVLLERDFRARALRDKKVQHRLDLGQYTKDCVTLKLHDLLQPPEHQSAEDSKSVGHSLWHLKPEALEHNDEATRLTRLCLLAINALSGRPSDLRHLAHMLPGVHLDTDGMPTISDMHRCVQLLKSEHQLHAARDVMDLLFPDLSTNTLGPAVIPATPVHHVHVARVFLSDAKQMFRRLLLVQGAIHNAATWSDVSPTTVDVRFLAHLTCLDPVIVQFNLLSEWRAMQKEQQQSHASVQRWCQQTLQREVPNAHAVTESALHMTIPPVCAMSMTDLQALVFVYYEALWPKPNDEISAMPVLEQSTCTTRVCVKPGSSGHLPRLSASEVEQLRWFYRWSVWSREVVEPDWGVGIPARVIVSWLTTRYHVWGALPPLQWFVALQQHLKTTPPDATLVQALREVSCDFSRHAVRDDVVHCRAGTCTGVQDTDAVLMDFHDDSGRWTVKAQEELAKEPHMLLGKVWTRVKDPVTLPYSATDVPAYWMTAEDVVQLLETHEPVRDSFKEAVKLNEAEHAQMAQRIKAAKEATKAVRSRPRAAKSKKASHATQEQEEEEKKQSSSSGPSVSPMNGRRAHPSEIASVFTRTLLGKYEPGKTEETREEWLGQRSHRPVRELSWYSDDMALSSVLRALGSERSVALLAADGTIWPGMVEKDLTGFVFVTSNETRQLEARYLEDDDMVQRIQNGKLYVFEWDSVGETSYASQGDMRAKLQRQGFLMQKTNRSYSLEQWRQLITDPTHRVAWKVGAYGKSTYVAHPSLEDGHIVVKRPMGNFRYELNDTAVGSLNSGLQGNDWLFVRTNESGDSEDEDDTYGAFAVDYQQSRNDTSCADESATFMHLMNEAMPEIDASCRAHSVHLNMRSLATRAPALIDYRCTQE